MHLNQSSNLWLTDPLIKKCESINIVDFKNLVYYDGSTVRDVKARIALGSAAFAKFESILRPPKVRLNVQIPLFKAACMSVLLYDCETWILTDTLIEELDIYARTCTCIMLSIKKSRDKPVPLFKTIWDRQLKLTCHCIRMPTDEPTNQYVIYKSRIRSSLRPRAQRTAYLNQIAQNC